MKRLALFLVLLPTLSFAQTKQPGEITSTYDRFKDSTTTSLYYMPVPTENFERLEVGAFYRQYRQAVVTEITLLFRSRSERWKYLREHERILIILADDERIRLGSIDRLDASVNQGGVVEVLGIELPIRTFEKIINAEKVEMQIGATEFHLTDGNIKYFRDFAAQIKP